MLEVSDSVTFLGTSERILHLEFQLKPIRCPPLPPPEETIIETEFQLEETHHRYRVVRMWEEEPQIFLEDNALLPFATLAAATNPEQLLNRVAQQVSMIESSEQRREISTRAQLLAFFKVR